MFSLFCFHNRTDLLLKQNGSHDYLNALLKDTSQLEM